MKQLHLLALAALTALFLLATPTSTSAFMLWNHSGISSEALGFLKGDVLTSIIGYDVAVDISYSDRSDYHFDGCKFQESRTNINNRYIAAVGDLDPANPSLLDAELNYGTLLHVVQDFYSHSNWIETGGSGILVDNGLALWKTLGRGTITKGVIVVEGENYPPGYGATRDKTAQYPENAIVTVHTPNRDFPGLITGVYSGDQEACPDDIEMTHGELNKDMGYTGKSQQFREAYSTAVKATTHEWCRLVNLVSLKYGQAGVDNLFSQWVADPNKAGSVCNQASPAQ